MDDGVAIKDDAEFEVDTLKVFNGKVEGGQDRSSELPHANEDKESLDQLLTEGPHWCIRSHVGKCSSKECKNG